MAVTLSKVSHWQLHGVCFSPTLTAIEVKDSVMRLNLRSILGLALTIHLAAPFGVAQTQPSSTPASDPKPLKVESGTKLELVLVEPLSSATAKKGQTVRLELGEPWIVDSRTILQIGAPATGVVSSVQHPIPGKRAGHVAVVKGSIQLPSGKSVPLSLSMPDYWDCDGAAGACATFAVLGAIVVVPLAAIDFVAHPKGTLNAFRGDSGVPNAGLDSDLPAGSSVRAWTKRSFELPQAASAATAVNGKLPSPSREPPCKAVSCVYQLNLYVAR